ncbi:MAG: hypothetical protein LIO93_10230 [Bacteroidales bacterium]|nr:hypothetical protein [Bacteroidales bacterium]
MNTNLWISKNKISLLILFLVFSLNTLGQTKYEERVDKYKSRWENLIPTHQKIQYAGGMGLFSLGVGWDYGKNNQWETDAFLGFLPRYNTKRGKVTFTLKQNFIPWKKRINHRISLEPLTTGMYVNTIFDNKFWMSNPDKYPNNYYTFSTKMRFWIFVGQRITFHFPEEKLRRMKEVTFFYELSSCDLYIVNAVGNSSLKPTDYLKLSFGLKFQIF